MDLTGILDQSNVAHIGSSTISGKNVRITHVDDTLNVQEQKAKSSGLHISVKGGAADVATTAYQSAKRGGEVEDGRFSALYAAKTAQTLQQGAGSLAGAGGQVNQAVADAQNGTSTDGGMSLRIGIGGSSSTNTSGYEQTSANGSSISSANGNVSIVAREGDLSIIGSQVDGNNVALAAANDLLLRSAAQGSDLSEKSKAQSGEIGITLGSEAGIGVYVSASAARGKGQGQGRSYAETTVNSRGTTTFVSGNDTVFDGAQLSGERVIGQVGGDLLMSSQQDSNDYERKDVAAGIDAAIGTGGGSVSGYASASKVDSRYTSVNQQSGIQAGAGGYQINVDGHTQLDGAAIASTASPDNNFFSTGSLGYSDIYNEAEYKAQSASVSGGSQGGGSASFSQTDEQASSITHAGIAAGTLIVKDGSGSGIQRGVTELQQEGLKDIFNQQDVAEQMELMQVAGEVGFTAAGDFAGQQGWQEGSKEKIALHGAVGAAMAALGGGNALTGAAAGSANQVALGAALNYLTEQGIDPASSQGEAIIQGVSLAVGAAVGGGEGASVALSATTNNYLTHQQEEALKEALAGCASSGDPQACKESAISTAQQQSAANNTAMVAACAGGQESPACGDMVADAKRYAENDAFVKDVTSHLDSRSDGYLFDTLAYDQWNSGTTAEDARLENDPVAWALDAIGCAVASIFGGCGSNPPPGSGQIDAVPIPGLEYGGELAAGLARLGGNTLSGVLSNATDNMMDDVADVAFRNAQGNFAVDGLPNMDFSQLSINQKMMAGELLGKDRINFLVPDGSLIGRSQGVGDNGIDDVLKVNRPGVDYVIVEYKFGQSKLGKTVDGVQGSDTWSTGSNRIRDAVGNDKTAQEVADAIRLGKVEHWVVNTDKYGNVAVGLLDKNGKFIPQPKSKLFGGSL